MKRRWQTKGGYKQLSLTVLLLPLLALSMCGRSKTATPERVTGPAAAVATTTYEGAGRVISLHPKTPSIELDHEDIKGLMPAMTMEFYVKDKSLLDGLQAGDHVVFSINNGVGGIIITKITKKS